MNYNVFEFDRQDMKSGDWQWGSSCGICYGRLGNRWL